MGIRDLTEARQREIAVVLARKVQHDHVPPSAAGREYDLDRQSVYYLLRKFGYGNATPPAPDQSAPFAIRDGKCLLTFDDVLIRRRAGASWNDLARECGSDKTGRSFSKMIRYHCERRGIAWPIVQVVREG